MEVNKDTVLRMVVGFGLGFISAIALKHYNSPAVDRTNCNKCSNISTPKENTSISTSTTVASPTPNDFVDAEAKNNQAATTTSASSSSSSNVTTTTATTTTPAVYTIPTEKDIIAAEEAEFDSIVDSDIVPANTELKMVICVRQDLNMSKGKIAAQVGHAVLGAYKICKRVSPENIKAWEYRAQAKITLKIQDEKQLYDVANAARQHGLAVCVIEDAGRTEVEPGTKTCKYCIIWWLFINLVIYYFV